MNKQYKYLLIATACTVLCGVIIYLFISLRGLQQQNEYLLSQSPAATDRQGRPQEDPYIAREVKNTIMKHRSEVGACYKDYLAKKPAKREGKIKYDWRIDENGKPVSPEVVFSDFGNSEFEKCIASKISGWDFPPPPFGRVKYVEHVFDIKEVQKAKNN